MSLDAGHETGFGEAVALLEVLAVAEPEETLEEPVCVSDVPVLEVDTDEELGKPSVRSLAPQTPGLLTAGLRILFK